MNRVILATAATALLATSLAAKNWSDWSAPTNIRSLNTAAIDGCASFSPDGLELWFTSSRPGGLGLTDIYVARRSSPSEPWGAAENAGEPINSNTSEACPTMTRGGRLYFTSFRRTGSAGDLYVSRRGPHGWGPLQALDHVNRNGSIEESATFFEDANGDSVMYFSSNRSGRNQIYQSVNGGPPTLVNGGVNSTAADARPTVSKDGLEIYFDSTRWSPPNTDLAVARRSSTSAEWGTAIRLDFSSPIPPGTFGAPGFDAKPSISWDRSELVFASNRPGTSGSIDLWTTRRTQQTGKN